MILMSWYDYPFKLWDILKAFVFQMFDFIIDLFALIPKITNFLIDISGIIPYPINLLFFFSTTFVFSYMIYKLVRGV